jgi:hypothetical protein
MYIVDFYVGRGDNAEYLGTGRSIAHLEPFDFQSLSDQEFTEQDFRDVVRSMVDTMTWPHEHADSSDTTWTYAYEKGSVYVYRKGVEMIVIRCNTHRTIRKPGGGPIFGGTDTVVRDWRPVNNFPTMKEATSA